MASWQDRWEAAAGAERQAFEALPLEDLLDAVRDGRYGSYYGLWSVIANRASLKDAGWVLFRALSENTDYLHRYHCARALLSLLGDTPWKPVDISGTHDGVEEAVAALRAVLASRIG